MEGNSLACVRCVGVTCGRECGGAKEGRDPFPWRDRRERMRGVEKCSIELAQEETRLDRGLGAGSTECPGLFCKQILEFKV